MKLTPELKAKLDNSSYAELLSHWRFAPIGDEIFQDESGKYYQEVMFAKRDADPAAAVCASKSIGWEK